MAGKFHHEEIHRGPEAVRKLAEPRITFCGVGAVGSLLADNLARQGFQHLRLIDRDRIEEHNVGTQLYDEGDVGARKADVLRNRIFRATGVEAESIVKELTDRNARKLLKGSDVVIDVFDNSNSRQLAQRQCRSDGLECLHVGLFEDYCEVVWDRQYRVPPDAEGDVCDYPMARNLVTLAITIASEALIRFVLEGERSSWSATLGDFSVRPLEEPVHDSA